MFFFFFSGDFWQLLFFLGNFGNVVFLKQIQVWSFAVESQKAPSESVAASEHDLLVDVLGVLVSLGEWKTAMWMTQKFEDSLHSDLWSEHNLSIKSYQVYWVYQFKK